MATEESGTRKAAKASKKASGAAKPFPELEELKVQIPELLDALAADAEAVIRDFKAGGGKIAVTTEAAGLITGSVSKNIDGVTWSFSLSTALNASGHRRIGQLLQIFALVLAD